jgi:hypothetical protein
MLRITYTSTSSALSRQFYVRDNWRRVRVHPSNGFTVAQFGRHPSPSPEHESQSLSARVLRCAIDHLRCDADQRELVADVSARPRIQQERRQSHTHAMVFAPAARRFRVVAAFRAAALRFRVIAALLAADFAIAPQCVASFVQFQTRWCAIISRKDSRL